MNGIMPGVLCIGFVDGLDIDIKKIDLQQIVFSTNIPLSKFVNLDLQIFDFGRYDYDLFSFENVLLEQISSNCYKILLAETSQDCIHRIKDLLKLCEFIEDGGMLSDVDDLVSPQPVYPVEKDSEIFEDLSSQEKYWYRYQADTDMDTKQEEQISFAVCLDSYTLYLSYVNNTANELLEQHIRDKGIAEHWIGKMSVSRIYIGNEFCFARFPTKELLLRCLDKGYSEGCELTVVFPFIREEYVLKMEEVLVCLTQWQKKNGISLELVFNDWGMLEYVRNLNADFQLVLGRLLNKKVKDTKFKYKWGIEQHKSMMFENSINLEVYSNFLEGYGVKRLEFDSLHTIPDIFMKKSSYHFPFFQTNTSLFCPLKANCEFNNVNRQEHSSECRQYCEIFSSLYPKHLNLIGLGNSIFGFQLNEWNDPQTVKHLVNSGYDRLVYHMLSSPATQKPEVKPL